MIRTIKISRTILFLLLIMAAVFLLSSQANAGTVTNSRTGTSYTIIQDALNATATGDTLWCEGKFDEKNITWPVSNNLTLMASPTATAPATIDAGTGTGGGMVRRIFTVGNAVNITIEGIHLINGYLEDGSSGAGMNLAAGVKLWLKKVIFFTCRTHESNQQGGAIYAANKTNTYIYATNCVFQRSWANGGVAYGGIWDVKNCIFYYCEGYPSIIKNGVWTDTNCTFYYLTGSPQIAQDSTYTSKNSIYWNFAGNYFSNCGTPNLTYSDFQQSQSGTGNISLDPGITCPITTDLIDPNLMKIPVNSPCKDVGISSGAPSTDYAGNPRPFGSGYDMGAYEFQVPPLVGHWSFDEGSGDTAFDSSGQGNNGTRYGATWVDGKLGKALSFDGTDDYVEIADADTKNLSGNDFVSAGGFTAAFWIYPTAPWSGDTYIMMKAIDHDSTDFMISSDWYGQWLAFRTHQTRFGHQRFYDTVNINTRLPAGEWHYIAITMIPKVGSSIKVYKDGKDITNDFYWHDGDGNQGWADWNGPFRIGANPLGIGWFKGIIDEAAIYNRALSSEEVLANYNSVIPPVVTIEAPTIGEVLSKGTQYAISWEASDNRALSPEAFTLWYTTNEGTDWQQVTTEVLGSFETTYIWNVPDTITNEAMISIEAVDSDGNIGYGISGKFAIVLDASLVGHWSFDEGSGDTVADSSGRGNNGTRYGATWVDSKTGLGKALSFDGVDDYVLVPDSDSLDMQNITIMAWVDLTSWSNGASKRIISHSWPGIHGIWEGYELVVGGDNGILSVGLWKDYPPDPKGFESVYSLSEHLNSWHHVAITYDYAQQKGVIYINGAPDKTTNGISVSMTPSDLPLLIGAMTQGASGYDSNWNGAIDEVRIYNRALSSDEVKAIYEAERGPDTTPPVVTMEAPATGEAITGGTQYTISWEASDNKALSPEAFTLWYTTNEGTVWQQVTTEVLGSFETTYIWNVPDTITNEAMISIEAVDSDGNIGYGISGKFVIVLDASLVGHWSFDEGSGDTVTDSSGYGNNGTKYGATRVDSIFGLGKALSFDGINNYIDIPLNIDAYPRVTFAAWIKPIDDTGRIMVSTNDDNATISANILFGLYNGNLYMRTYDGGVRYIGGATTLTLDQWHHVVLTAENNNEYKVYLDGNIDGSTNAGTRSSSTKVLIGHRAAVVSEYGPEFFNGSMDEVAIYNRALSSEEVKAIYDAEKPDTTPPIVTIEAPATGEVISAGSQYAISWEASDNLMLSPEAFTLWYTTNEGTAWQQVTTEVLGSFETTYLWNVPSVITNEAMISIEAKDLAGNIGYGISGKFAVVLDASLVGHWSFDEGSGDTVTDSSGKGNNGSLINMDPGTAWTAGKVGTSALSFDGINDYLRIPSNAGYETVPITISFWVNRQQDIAVGTHALLFGYTLHQAADIAIEASSDYYAAQAQDKIIFLWLVPDVGWAGIRSDTVTSTLLPKNVWTHVVFTRSATGTPSTTKIYIDGAEVGVTAIGSNSAPSLTFPTPLYLGGNGDVNTAYFNAAYDEIAIYNRALSSDEVKAIYEAERGPDTTPPVVTIEAPTTGAVISGGTQYAISWEASDNVALTPEAFTLWYTTNEGTDWQPITTEVLGSFETTYLWTVPNIITNEAMISIEAVDSDGNIGYGISGKFAVVLDASLVGYWSFEEGLGDAVTDSSGYGNNGNRYGATWAIGEGINGSNTLSFNGTDNYIEIENENTKHLSGNDFISSGGFTSMLWIKPASWNGDATILFKGSNTDNADYMISNDWYGSLLAFRVDGQRFYDSANINDRLPPGEWHQIAITMIPNVGSSIKVYKDGNDITNGFGWHDGDGNQGWTTNGGPFHLAANPGGGSWFNGKIDEVRIYNRVLSSDEVKAIFEAERGPDATPPVVTIEAPSTGETLTGGSQYTISWEASDNVALTPEAFTLWYTTNEGTDWQRVTTEVLGSFETTYLWTVPNIITNEAMISIEAVDSDGNIGYGISGKFEIFDITPPVVTIEAPTTGNVLTGETQYMITWEASDNGALSFEAFTLWFSSNEGKAWQKITTQVLGSQETTYLWNVPNVATKEAMISVEARDWAGNIGSGVSGTFEIAAPPAENAAPLITVEAPNGGEKILIGSYYNIRWLISGAVTGNVKVRLSTDNGVTWGTLITQEPAHLGETIYSWKVPDTTYNNCMISIEAGNLGTWNYDASDGTFEIVEAATSSTPSGDNITIEVGGTTLVFSQVTSPGITTITSTSEAPAPLPETFALLGTYYDFSTTAKYSGSITVTFPYDDADLSPAQENGLKLQQYDNGHWVDITKSLDTISNIITGEAPHLSYFAITKFAAGPVIDAIWVNGIRFKSGDIISSNVSLEANITSESVVNPALTTFTVDGVPETINLVSGSYTDGRWLSNFKITASSQKQSHALKFHLVDNNTREVTYNARVLKGNVQMVGTPHNFPNPFSPMSGGSTTIQYTLSTDATITIIIYDITGHEIKRMKFRGGSQGGRGGTNQASWDGRSLGGEFVGNGMYLYKIISGDQVIGSGKLVIFDQ